MSEEKLTKREAEEADGIASDVRELGPENATSVPFYCLEKLAGRVASLHATIAQLTAERDSARRERDEAVDDSDIEERRADDLAVQNSKFRTTVASLRAALGEALDAWSEIDISIAGPVRDRIAALRKLAQAGE